MQACRTGLSRGRTAELAILLLLSGTPWLAAGDDGKKSPLPAPALVVKAEALVHELYSKEYDKAQKDVAARSQLALTLLQEGRDTNDDLAGKYVLFREARDLAARAGDAPTALQASDDLAHSFSLPDAKVLEMKIEALGLASKAVAGPDAYQTVVDSALVLAQEAMAADEYEAALALLATADAAAIKLKNVPLVSSIRVRRQEVRAGQKEYANWKPFAEALRKDPTDPKANMNMGVYQAMVKGNWDKGLPLLARGSDPVLKQLAAMDLEGPKQPSQQAELAEKWLELAGKSTGKTAVQLLLRAYHWDVLALAGLDGEARRRVEKQMEAITKRLPPELRAGEIVQEILKIDAPGGPVYSVAFSPDGRKAVAGGADTAVSLWDTITGKEIRRLEGHTGRVWTVAAAPVGRRLASGGFDGSIRLWDPATGREVRRLPGHGDYVRCVVFSQDGRQLLSGGDDRLLRLWSADTGRELRSLPGHDHFVWSVALSADGRHALSGSLDKTVRLWDLADGKELKTLTGHQDTVLAVALSPDGRHALSGSTDKTVKLWDLESGKPLYTLSGHSGYVNSVSYSPDGRRALSAGHDGSLILWDVFAGKMLRRLQGHRGPVWSVAFARDGRRAVSGGQDGTIRIWGGRQSALVSRP
jgi:hypothetical protein